MWRNVCHLSIPFFTSIVSVLFWQLPSALLPINFLNFSERLLLFDAFKNKELRGCEKSTKSTFSAIFSWYESELDWLLGRFMDLSRVVLSRPMVGPFATRYFSHLFYPSRFATSVIFAVCRQLSVKHSLNTPCIQ